MTIVRKRAGIVVSAPWMAADSGPTCTIDRGKDAAIRCNLDFDLRPGPQWAPSCSGVMQPENPGHMNHNSALLAMCLMA